MAGMFVFVCSRTFTCDWGSCVLVDFHVGVLVALVLSYCYIDGFIRSEPRASFTTLTMLEPLH